MPTTARRYTVDEVLAFPADGNRYELVQGELLVTPAPSWRHQALVGLLFHRLQTYLAPHADRAMVVLSPADIVWAQDELVQPDVFVVPAGEVSRDWSTIESLLLAVEVVSPGSVTADRVTKRRLYQKRGVATYWAVEQEAPLVEVWRPEDDRPEIVTEELRWRVAPEAEELAIDLGELFAKLP
ncbi:MAG: Uma2 family endonuclease [Gemmatimonadales bacterium]